MVYTTINTKALMNTPYIVIVVVNAGLHACWTGIAGMFTSTIRLYGVWNRVIICIVSHTAVSHVLIASSQSTEARESTLLLQNIRALHAC